MAAVFALSLVPAGAWAASGTGRFPDTEGTLTVKNSAKDEQYSAWRILTLASFSDGDVDKDKHASDAYSYVIKSDSGWNDFFDSTKKPSGYTGVWGSDYFTVDPNPIAIGGGTYYLVTPKDDVTINPTMQNPFSDDASATPVTQKDETTADEWQSTNKVQQFAQAAVNYATTIKHLSADASGTGTGSDLPLSDGTDTNLPLGWYVVDSTQGTLCSLDTLNPNVTIEDKNDLPTLDKTVQEDSIVDSTNGASDGDNLNGYQNVDDAEVGELVYYRSVIQVKDGAVGYTLRDYMDQGLTWDTTYGLGGVQVWFVPSDKNLSSTEGWISLTGSDADANVTNAITKSGGSTYKSGTTLKTADYYTLSSTGTYNMGTPNNNGDDKTETFEVAFGDDFMLFLSDNIDATTTYYYLVVDYRATVNEKAVVGATGNLNRTYLEYGQKDAKSQTPQDQTVTYTWPVHVYKYTETNQTSGTKKPLPGAVFELWNDETATTASGNVKKYSFVKLNVGDVGYDSTVGSDYPQYKVIDANAILASATETTTYYDAAGAALSGSTGAAYSVTKKTAEIDLVGSGTATSHEFYEAITTDTTGKFYIAGLDDDIYYLREAQAPNGYNKLSYPVKTELTSTTVSGGASATAASLTKVEYVSTKSDQTNYDSYSTGGATSAAPIEIQNSTGAELPSTGGIGTTIFYVAGTVLVVGAVVMLVAKRRMGAEA